MRRLINRILLLLLDWLLSARRMFLMRMTRPCAARELVRDSFRQIKKQNAENHVNGEKLDAFDPVGFAIAADLKQDVNRSDHGEDFWSRKLEVHRLTKQIGDE